MKRNEHETLEVPLSTLIDVVFLLIIFFVITATIQKEIVDDKVKLAESHFVEPDPPKSLMLTVNIRHRDSQPPVYSVGGAELSYEQLRRRFHQFYHTAGSELPVVIRASHDLEYREIDRINRLAMEIGIVRVRHAAEAKP